MIKFQEAQGIKELNSVNLAAYLVKVNAFSLISNGIATRLRILCGLFSVSHYFAVKVDEHSSSDTLILLQYANDVNIGKVPWQSLITLIQKGKSLAGNLVELINQLCAENQWKDLGVEFYRLFNATSFTFFF